MAHVEIPDQLAGALGRIAGVERLLVGLDFDGTLAPFNVDLHASRATPRSMAAVRALAGMPGVRVALVSGRALESLEEVSHAPAGVVLVGSHGLERRMGDGRLLTPPLAPHLLQALDELGARVRAVAARAPGSLVEVKPTSVSLHTRGVSDPSLARRAESEVREAARGIPGVHVMEGKRLVELAVQLGDKGQALEQLRTSPGADAVFYAGDDTTDERAFAVLGPQDLGVHVGAGPTGAAFCVPDIPQLEDVLEALVALRARR